VIMYTLDPDQPGVQPQRHPFCHGLQKLPWLEVDPSLGSTQDLETISCRLSTFQSKHKHCAPPAAGNGFFPTRVLDVTHAKQGLVHLRDRDNVVDVQPRGCYPAYWTLSHRWGDPKTIL